MKELPYLKNIIASKCTQKKTEFYTSCDVDEEIFKRMKSNEIKVFIYELESPRCVVILGDTVSPKNVTDFYFQYTVAYSQVKNVSHEALPRSTPELVQLSERLGIPLLEE